MDVRRRERFPCSLAYDRPSGLFVARSQRTTCGAGLLAAPNRIGSVAASVRLPNILVWDKERGLDSSPSGILLASKSGFVVQGDRVQPSRETTQAVADSGSQVVRRANRQFLRGGIVTRSKRRVLDPRFSLPASATHRPIPFSPDSRTWGRGDSRRFQGRTRRRSRRRFDGS